MDLILTDSRGCTYVSAQLLGRIYPSWPWPNDATVVHDYAILMKMMIWSDDTWATPGEFNYTIVSDDSSH